MLSDQDGAALCLPLRDDAAQLIDGGEVEI